MKQIFSVQHLIRISIFVLSLLAVYMLFQIGPYFSFFWDVLVTVSIPFIISMILAYLLHPLVDGLMKFRLNRTLAILILYFFFLGAIGLLLWLGTPIFAKQLQELMGQLPTIEKQLYDQLVWLDQRLDHLPSGLHHGIENAIGNMEQSIILFIENIVQYIGESLDSFFVLFVIPFLVFYLLHDVEVIAKVLYTMTPKEQRKPLTKLWRDIDRSLGEYIRGQITVSLIVGLLALIGYYFIGLPYAFFLAFIVSVTNIIPYFGPFIGATPAVLVAFLTNPSLILWVILINTAIQILEGNWLAPSIVAKRLHIHPLFIILVLLIGAEIGGVIGLILAVPVFVILKVVITNSVLHMRQYKDDSKIDRI